MAFIKLDQTSMNVDFFFGDFRTLLQTDSRVWEPLAKVLWQCLGLRVSGPYSQDEEKAYDMDDDEIEEEESGPESDEEA